MSKYGTGQDPYCYEGTDVLKNLLNQTEPEDLEAAEREITTTVQDSIEFEPPPYNFASLKQLHKQLFQDIYPWAGQIRSIDMGKGSTRFCTAGRIEPEVNKLFGRLGQQNYFESFSRDALIQAMARFYGDLNAIHPFREGNGRVGRILCEFITINAGYGIDWSPVRTSLWLDASIDSVACNYQSMEQVFDLAITSDELFD